MNEQDKKNAEEWFINLGMFLLMGEAGKFSEEYQRMQDECTGAQKEMICGALDSLQNNLFAVQKARFGAVSEERPQTEAGKKWLDRISNAIEQGGREHQNADDLMKRIDDVLAQAREEITEKEYERLLFSLAHDTKGRIDAQKAPRPIPFHDFKS